MTAVYSTCTLPTSLLDAGSGALPAQLWVQEGQGDREEPGSPTGPPMSTKMLQWVSQSATTGRSQPYGVSPVLLGGAGRHGISIH